MVSSDIVVSIQGDKELIAKLDRFGVSILDLSKSMDEIGRYLTGFFSGEVFASRGGVIGKSWAPLDDDYAAAKARRFPGRPPLVRSGLMQRGFKHRSTALTSRIHNEAPYFDYHQAGTSKMPARVMMHMDETRARAVVALITDDITGKMRQADV